MNFQELMISALLFVSLEFRVNGFPATPKECLIKGTTVLKFPLFSCLQTASQDNHLTNQLRSNRQEGADTHLLMTNTDGIEPSGRYVAIKSDQRTHSGVASWIRALKRKKRQSGKWRFKSFHGPTGGDFDRRPIRNHTYNATSIIDNRTSIIDDRPIMEPQPDIEPVASGVQASNTFKNADKAEAGAVFPKSKYRVKRQTCWQCRDTISNNVPDNPRNISYLVPRDIVDPRTGNRIRVLGKKS